MRYAPPSPSGGGLDIAITDYVHPDGGPTVSLVGVVHVADPLYFEAMQEELDRYDIVLYEGVKPADLSVVDWQSEAKDQLSSLSSFQRRLASWFGFDFQLDTLDYGRAHFRHADMTMEQFVEEGGDKILPLPAPAREHEDDDGRPRLGRDEEEPERTGRGVTDAVQGTLDQVLRFGEGLLDKPNPLRSMARRMFAETMGTADIGTSLEMIPGFAELILIRRNEVVMERLEETLTDAEGSIAIFYGAAHMPDLEERLEALGYERRGARWLRAWALRKPLR